MATQVADATTIQPRVATDRGLGALRSEDFFKILVTELRQQDPLAPSKTADMINQVAQIRSIELSKRLTDTLTQLGSQQQTAGASALLGKHVTATVTGPDGAKRVVSGIVTGVRFTSDGAVVLELDTGQSVLASNVTRITSPEVAETQTSTASSGSSSDDSAAASSGTDKSGGTSKQSIPRLLPWLSLDGEIHL
jgi:flagellar basal-body rod modification protein FlgD